MLTIFSLDIREINLLSIVLRVALSMLIGGILGIERGRKNRPAGLRTYMLVCLGATLVMMTNQYVFQVYNTSDPVRMGAQVVSGIGFLGAGTIIVTGRNQVKGMTTAAGLWTAACCGLAIGIGFYEAALIGGISVFAVMSVMQSMDVRIRSRSKIIDIYVEPEGARSVGGFLHEIRSLGFEISDVQLNKGKYMSENIASLFLTLHAKSYMPHENIVDMISDVDKVKHIEEIG